MVLWSVVHSQHTPLGAGVSETRDMLLAIGLKGLGFCINLPIGGLGLIMLFSTLIPAQNPERKALKSCGRYHC